MNLVLRCSLKGIYFSHINAQRETKNATFTQLCTVAMEAQKKDLLLHLEEDTMAAMLLKTTL